MAGPKGPAILIIEGYPLPNSANGTQFARRAHRTATPGCPNVTQCGRLPEGRMSQAERFAHLLKEFERVGVDPNTISAGLAVQQSDVLRALSALPDGAGPAAFLSQLRIVMTQPAGADDQTGHRRDSA
jgi:hypothetical protein